MQILQYRYVVSMACDRTNDKGNKNMKVVRRLLPTYQLIQFVPVNDPPHKIMNGTN